MKGVVATTAISFSEATNKKSCCVFVSCGSSPAQVALAPKFPQSQRHRDGNSPFGCHRQNPFLTDPPEPSASSPQVVLLYSVRTRWLHRQHHCRGHRLRNLLSTSSPASPPIPPSPRYKCATDLEIRTIQVTGYGRGGLDFWRGSGPGKEGWY